MQIIDISSVLKKRENKTNGEIYHIYRLGDLVFQIVHPHWYIDVQSKCKLKDSIFSFMEFEVPILKFTWKGKDQKLLNHSWKIESREICFSRYQDLKLW